MEKTTVNINGTMKEYDSDVMLLDIAKEFKDDYDNDIIASFRDGNICELFKPLGQCSTVKFITVNSSIGHKIYVRGVKMMLLKALYEIYGFDKINKIRIEASIGQGYYCELDGIDLSNDNKLAEVEALMQSYVEKDIRFVKKSIHIDEAVRLFKSYNMTDKVKLFKYRRSSSVNVYNLDGFVDYFFGYMPYSTGVLKCFSLKPYKDGFVLIIPDGKKDNNLIKFNDSPKFYSVLKESNEWGRSMRVDTVGALNDAVVEGRFKDIVMIQEALHEKRIGDIAAEIAKDKDVKIILIAGPSSSGKTTFSHRLSIQLSTFGLIPHPIPVDDYFVNREDTPLNEDGSYNYECLEALDVEQFNKDMLGLLAGERVELPTFNFVTGKREYKGKYKQLGKDDILVIEGIHGLNDKLTYLLPKESKYKIYISALTQLNIDEHNRIPTTDGRLLRRIVRDARTRGADAKKTISMWQSVRNGEENYIFPYQEDADSMFNSALIYELAVLKQYAEPLLFKISPDEEEYTEAKRLLKFLNYFLGVSSEGINYNSILREFIGGSILPV
ncbi:MAG: nucleoside kinase [Lachnospiraceae bacterium]|nr:nucleoside kinase [Lachnospiraceae bacterium]